MTTAPLPIRRRPPRKAEGERRDDRQPDRSRSDGPRWCIARGDRARRPGHGGRRQRRPAGGPRLHRDRLSAAALFLVVGNKLDAPEPLEDALRRLLRRSDQGRHHPVAGLGGRRHGDGRLGRRAAGLARPALRRGLVELRPAAAGAYLRGDLRLRRQRADRHLLPRHAAHLPGAAARPDQPLVRADRLQPLLRHRRQRLPDGRHPVEGIRRARVVRRHLAGDRLGHLLRALPPHARPPERAAHLRGQLVLPRLHPGRGGAAHRQQPGGAGLASPAPRATRPSPACRTR